MAFWVALKTDMEAMGVGGLLFVDKVDGADETTAGSGLLSNLNSTLSSVIPPRELPETSNQLLRATRSMTHHNAASSSSCWAVLNSLLHVIFRMVLPSRHPPTLPPSFTCLQIAGSHSPRPPRKYQYHSLEGHGSCG